MQINHLNRISLISVALLTSPFIYGDPNVISDSTKQVVTHCGYYLNALPKVEVPVAKDADGNAYCKVDISAMPVGSNTVKLTFVHFHPVFGRQESVPSLPLAVIRPTIPLAPTNLTATP